MKVHLHIDRLVLEGIAVPHRGKLQAAVERELASLIAERGLGAVTSIAVPSMRAPEPVQADLASGIASAVHGAIGGTR